MPQAKDGEIENVTLYMRGEMFGNVVKVECRTLRIRVRQWAQYESAVELTYVPKGKRAARVRTLGFKPWGFVLAGYGNLDPDSFLGPETVTPAGVGVRQSRYSACDGRWQTDFEAKLGDTPVLADFRGHDPHAARSGAPLVEGARS